MWYTTGLSWHSSAAVSRTASARPKQAYCSYPPHTQVTPKIVPGMNGSRHTPALVRRAVRSNIMPQQHMPCGHRPVHQPAWGQAGWGQGVHSSRPRCRARRLVPAPAASHDEHGPSSSGRQVPVPIRQELRREQELEVNRAAWPGPAASTEGQQVAEVAIPAQVAAALAAEEGAAAAGPAHAGLTRKAGSKAAKKAARKARHAQQVEQLEQELEAKLLAATTRQQLMDYVASEQMAPLRPSELVFVLNQLARLCEAKSMNYRAFMQVKEFVHGLLAKYPGHVSQLNAYELTVIISALARVKHQPAAEWLTAFFTASQPHIPSYGPGYLHLLLRSLVRMEIPVYELRSVSGFRDWQETILSVSQNKVWAYRGDELVRTLSAVSQLKWRPSPEWRLAFSAAIKARLDCMDPPLLSQALLALSIMKQQPHPALLKSLMSQLDTKLPMFDDRDLASTAQALQLVKRVMHADYFSAFMVEVASKATDFSGASLAALLDAFATLISRKLMLVSTPYAAAASSPGPAVVGVNGAASSPGPAVVAVNGAVNGAAMANTAGAHTVGSSAATGMAAAVAGSRVNGAAMVSTTAMGTATAATGSNAGSTDSVGSMNSNVQPARRDQRNMLFQQQRSVDGLAVRPASQSTESQPGRDGTVVGPSHLQPTATAASPSLNLNGSSTGASMVLQAPQPRAARAASPLVYHDVAALQPLPYDRVQLAALTAARTPPSPRRPLPDPVYQRSESNPYPPKPPLEQGSSELGMNGWTVVLPAASPAWLRLMETSIQSRLASMSVPEASKALRGLGMMGHQVQPALLERFFAASKVKLHAAWPACYVYMVQAVALSGYQPTGPEGEQLFREWLEVFSRVAARRSFTPDQVCDMVSALAALPVRPPDILLSAILTHTRRNRPAALKHASPRRLALLIAALRRLQYRPDFGFLHSFAQAVRYHWTNAEPAELTAVMVALAALSPPPLAVDERWVADLLVTIQCRLDRFDGPCLASTLAAVVALGTDPKRTGPTGPALPSPRFCELVFDRLLEQQRSLAPSHATSVLWAVACLHRSYMEDVSFKTLSTVAESATEQRWSRPPHRLIAAMTACISGGAQRLSPAQIEDAVWALQTLGHVVPPALQQARQQLHFAAMHASTGNGNGHTQAVSGQGVVSQTQPEQQALEQAEMNGDMLHNHIQQQQQQQHTVHESSSSSQGPVSHPLDLRPLKQSQTGPQVHHTAVNIQHFQTSVGVGGSGDMQATGSSSRRVVLEGVRTAAVGLAV